MERVLERCAGLDVHKKTGPGLTSARRLPLFSISCLGPLRADPPVRAGPSADHSAGLPS
jgi:hypothetical protein